MKGLLLKDFLVVTKQAKLFLLIILVFAVTAGEGTIPFAICYGAMLPITALAYDEQSKWNSLANMMPYSAFDIVFGKYLLGYIISLTVGALCAAAQLVSNIVKGEALNEYVLVSALLYISAALLIQAVDLPVMFGFGVEKGRLWFMLFNMVLILSVVFGNDFILSAVSSIKTIPSTVLAASVFLFIAAVNALSVFISMKVYKREK